MIAILSLLKGNQLRLVDKMSELVIASSSSDNDPFESVSSLSDNGKTNFWTDETWKMFKSKNGVDKRLINFFRLKKNLVQKSNL